MTIRDSRGWLLIGIGLLVVGALPLLEGGARGTVIAAGVLVALLAGTRMLKNEDDDNRREPPCPPGGRGSNA